MAPTCEYHWACPHKMRVIWMAAQNIIGLQADIKIPLLRLNTLIQYTRHDTLPILSHTIYKARIRTINSSTQVLCMLGHGHGSQRQPRSEAKYQRQRNYLNLNAST